MESKKISSLTKYFRNMMPPFGAVCLKRLLLVFILLLCQVSLLKAQGSKNMTSVKYRRSSLHTILMESKKFPMRDTVIRAYYNAPFPDKYNNHTAGPKSFDPRPFATRLDSMGNPDPTEHPSIISKYLKESQMARSLVAKWFNRKADGSFSMDTIGARGSYDASALQVSIAKGSARGTAMLADAGEELISNTFVVVTQLNFYSNAPIAKAVYDGAMEAVKAMGSSNGLETLVKESARAGVEGTYKMAKEGYTVLGRAYLYQLVWNDSVASVFYKTLWMDKSNVSTERKADFDKTDLFKLKYIGDENARSVVLLGSSPKHAIEVSTIRIVGNVFSRLQKKYDVFKTKTPLFTGYPITAKIGMKEGLDKGDRFEVLEQVLDPGTERTRYVTRGKITIHPDSIWDNRYSLANGPIEEDSELTQPGSDAIGSVSDEEIQAILNGSVSLKEIDIVAGSLSKKEEKIFKLNELRRKLDRTTFEGGKNYYSGMLIRQIR